MVGRDKTTSFTEAQTSARYHCIADRQQIADERELECSRFGLAIRFMT